MRAAKATKTEIGEIYSEALLAQRLRGVEGVPAKRMALARTVEAVRVRWGVDLTETEIRGVLRIDDRSPFRLAPVVEPRRLEPVMDRRVAALLAHLREAIMVPGV